MSKEKYKINDPDVRSVARLYKLLIYIMGAIISVAMVVNTFSIGRVGYNIYQKWNDEKALSEYAIELNTKPSNYLVFECDYINSTSLYEFCKKIYRTIIPNIECELEDLPDIEEYLPNNKLKLYIPIK
jgi:predicted transcriptional regulator YdeE